MSEKVREAIDTDEAINAVPALSPLLPIGRKDVIGTARMMLNKAVQKPRLFGKSVAAFLREEKDILTGNSDRTPHPKDRRFKDEAWQQNRFYRTLLQSYLAGNDAAHQWLKEANSEELELERHQYLLNIILSGLSPSNYLATNPEAMEYALETKGGSVSRGLRNFVADLRHNGGTPSQIADNAFQKGRDVAALPGSVVFRNELLELIQYQPTTARVNQRPLLFVNSVINRYYMSDLTPQRSLYKYLVDQGIQLFSAVWRNPSPEHAHWGMEEYVEALIEAMDATREISGQETLNTLGLCAGGTITLATMAYLAKAGDCPVHANTILVNVVDNAADDTVLSILGTPKAVASARKRINRKGVFSANAMRSSFNMMQPDKLIWPYVVENYLFGTEPQASEIMYWMNDQVALPARLYNEFMDFMFDNTLAKGAFELQGKAINLGNITTETLLVGALQDHICPWHAGYRTRNLLGGKVEYLLSSGGHTTPMTSPTEDPRAKYYTNSDLSLNHDEWLAGAVEQDASWRSFWSDWLSKRSGLKVKAQVTLGSPVHPPLDPAPGTYVFK